MSDPGKSGSDAKTPPAPSLVLTLSRRLALVGLAFMLIQLLAVISMYVNNTNELDQLLVTAEASKIAADIPRIRADGGAIPEELHHPLFAGARRAFHIHDRSGAIIGRFDNGNLTFGEEAPASFLVIRTQREEWDDHFLLSGTRRVMVKGQPYWISVAISGTGFRPFIPVLYDEVAFHVIFPVILLSVMFVFFNISAVRSTLKPLRTVIDAINQIDPAQISTRIDAATSTREAQALVAAVNRMLARIERSVRALREFAGNAAHELRTPLAIMLLSIGKLPDGDVKSKLLKDAHGMKRLVDQMLDMAQATALEIDGRALVPLTAVARDVVADLTPLAITRGRSLVFHDTGAPEIRGHSDAIGRALRNVIENGLAHSPAGAAVEIFSGPGPCYTVRDHGAGIPEDRRAKVTERFYRVNQSGNEGSGLGLAIVLAIMEAHGGNVEISAANGGGTLVRLNFGAGRSVPLGST
ncbi:HAMP domain-containing sensor histidine kinase [Rhodoblastus sp.]|jgi:signal transduction histidine kinase|uniref:sensor histidine kinase n=1 Tax=Rhodoblastus sp. TaxID=1962975 RepID=UPI00260120F0|nr:HAMP domain-containing sensor histidine kinase [Rhodoblastus sp.]